MHTFCLSIKSSMHLPWAFVSRQPHVWLCALKCWGGQLSTQVLQVFDIPFLWRRKVNRAYSNRFKNSNSDGSGLQVGCESYEVMWCCFIDYESSTTAIDAIIFSTRCVIEMVISKVDIVTFPIFVSWRATMVGLQRKEVGWVLPC